MTLTELKDKANAKLADMWPKLQNKQDQYYAKHGKYFQLLMSPIDSVVDDVDSAFEVRNPSDEMYIVDIDAAWTETVPFNIQVHEWVGAGDDRGYQARVLIQLPDGTQYARHRDSNAVDTGWFQVPVIEQ